ncbi:MAG: metal-sulfur cluster assembly factor [Candidatus Aenigmarchaeota archaeon]|nr:metal-sulfur cluster assembly factor [Candidatus Aenigmarchaeota archaeon]
MLSERKVRNALKKVVDPEIGLSVVDLGLIYDLKVEGENVKVKMTLTSILCPYSFLLVENVKKELEKIGAKNVDVEITFTPPWTPERISKKARKILKIS